MKTIHNKKTRPINLPSLISSLLAFSSIACRGGETCNMPLENTLELVAVNFIEALY